MLDIFSKYGIVKPEDKVLCLAPMEGVTNRIFRELLLKHSHADIVATEFIRITSERQRVRPFPVHRVPLQIQIMGKDKKLIVGSLKFLKSEGLISNDSWIDLNVGCPSKRVTSKGAGSALLLEPKKLLDIVEEIRVDHPGPLSIKTRIGFQDAEEYPAILEVLKKAPLDFISIHGRTKCGQYSEPVNLLALKQAVETLPYPVIGNGDIWEVKDAIEMINITGVRGVMCGRGVMRNPFLMEEIKGYFQNLPLKSDGERRENLFHFFFKLIDCYRNHENKKRNFTGAIKEFSVWFSRNSLIGREFFDAIKRLQNLEEIRNAALQYAESIETFNPETINLETKRTAASF